MSAPNVVLHQPDRGPRAPNLSPFAMKLETYLRMAKVNYTKIFGRKASPKGKIPWMTVNGEVVADSQFCIEHLNRKLNIDLNKHLTPEQRAVARAFQKMAEDDLFWCIACIRLKHLEWVRKMLNIPKLLLIVFRRRLGGQTHAQGMGRHSYDEMLHIMEGDLAAISEFLGSKKFLMGDVPCETDCAVFGQLAQLYWQMPDTEGEKVIREKFRNLCDYCERMKTTFWPDWEECITKDATVKATK